MKYFIFAVLLFSALLVNAQMNVEEIAYVPSPSGYYNNLVVKGNVKVKDLKTYPFNIQSYVSVLNMNVNSTYGTTIRKINTSSGTVVMLDADYSSLSSPIQLNMQSGNFSVKTKNSSSKLDVYPLLIQDSFSTYSETQNVTFPDTFSMDNNSSLYIMGMQVPQGNYYWQKVKTESNTCHYILVESDSKCSNKADEEACVVNGYKWWPDECKCTSQSGSSSIPLPSLGC